MSTVKLLSAWALRILACWVLFSALPAHAETPLAKGLCEEGWEQSGWLCYPKCKDNFHGRGPVCWQNCPSGFTDYGVGCSDLHVYDKHSYGRGAGGAMWCASGLEQNGALCYPFCRDGYHGVGPVCWGGCPEGTDTDFGATCTRWMRITGWNNWFIFRIPIIDWGWTKGKPSYGRGWGEPLSACAPGNERNGALCYPFCNGGYTGAGPVCWQNCRGGYHDDGAFCRRDNGFTKARYGRGAGVPLSLCPNYARNTHYPIVLVHGWLGAPSYLDFGLKWFPGSTSYWGGIVDALKSGSRGNKNVFVARVSPTGTNTSRGEELRRFVEEVTIKTGHSRVHLIGHSQGGPTSRYVAAVAPEMVASVTTVAGVNHSPAFATTLTKWDQVLDGGDPNHGLVRMAFDAVALGVNLAAYGAAPGEHWDNSKPLYAMTENGMKLFNWMFPWGLTDIQKGKGENWSNPLAFVSRPKTFDGKDAKEYLEIMGTGNLFKYKESLEQFQKSANEYKDNVTYHPEQHPVLYYSWAGKPPYTGSWGLNFQYFNPAFWSGNAGAPGFTLFNETTMLAAAVMAAANKITEDSLKAAPGDGMVDGQAARLGVQVGQYNLDHLMISNSFQSNVPLTHLWGKAHPITLFCEHANRLVQAERDILKLDKNGMAPTLFTGIKVTRYGQGVDGNGRPITVVPVENQGPDGQNVIQPLPAEVLSDPLGYIASYSDLIRVIELNESAAREHYARSGRSEGRTILFDAQKYLAKYSDLRNSFGDPQDTSAQWLAKKHYIKTGFNEGRTYPGISPMSDPLGYVASHPDLIRAIGTDERAAIEHFVRHGRAEGRTVNFDPEAYLFSNPDLHAPLKSDRNAAKRHYILHGFKEGRETRSDPLGYIASYPDLIRTIGVNEAAASEHYARFGKSEGRAILFDAKKYIEKHADLRMLFGDPQDKTAQLRATEHYIKHGFSDGRTYPGIPPMSDPLGYVASHPDLIQSIGSDERAAIEHYVTYGKVEGRTVNFDPEEYLFVNPDLRVALKNDRQSAKRHYILHGFKEGRRTR